MPSETAGPGIVAKAEQLVLEWNYAKTELANGMIAYAKPVFGSNGNINSLIFLFPFGDPSFDAVMMEIVAYLPQTVPEKDRAAVAEFVARTALSTVCFTQLDMESGIVCLKQRIFLQGRVFSPDLMTRIGNQVVAEADVLLPVLNKMIYAGLPAKDAMAEVDANLGYGA
ncbi:MAG: hypothetical protein GYA23_08450 [Methanomicrobiales archaeon]|nr:hypothetical protein [Methanomicrobiales archaeon]